MRTVTVGSSAYSFGNSMRADTVLTLVLTMFGLTVIGELSGRLETTTITTTSTAASTTSAPAATHHGGPPRGGGGGAGGGWRGCAASRRSTSRASRLSASVASDGPGFLTPSAGRPSVEAADAAGRAGAPFR